MMQNLRFAVKKDAKVYLHHISCLYKQIVQNKKQEIKVLKYKITKINVYDELSLFISLF